MTKLAQHGLHSAVGVAVVAPRSRTVLLLVEDVVVTLLDRLGAQDVIEPVTTRMFIRPLLDGVEHVSVDLEIVVTQSRVMESTNHVVDDLIYRYTGILPSVQDATTQGSARR